MEKPNTLIINTLHGNWCDKDIIMLHACFQLLTDCVEKEQLLTGHVSWTHDEEHVNAKKEIEELYNWWLERIRNDKADGVSELAPEQYHLDNEMLIRLINVRKYLWT